MPIYDHEKWINHLVKVDITIEANVPAGFIKTLIDSVLLATPQDGKISVKYRIHEP